MKLILFFFQAEDGIRDHCVTGVQTCALPILRLVEYLIEEIPTAHTIRRFEPDIGCVDPTVDFIEIGRASCRERV